MQIAAPNQLHLYALVEKMFSLALTLTQIPCYKLANHIAFRLNLH